MDAHYRWGRAVTEQYNKRHPTEKKDYDERKSQRVGSKDKNKKTTWTSQVAKSYDVLKRAQIEYRPKPKKSNTELENEKKAACVRRWLTAPINSKFSKTFWYGLTDEIFKEVER